MSKSKLFEPLLIGNIRLDHRIALAPLTRYRCDDDRLPLPMVKEYYIQRASVPGTLLISEATLISSSAVKSKNTPGLYNKAQIAAWRDITDAVHAKGCFIYCQLWHFGNRTGLPLPGEKKETAEYLKIPAPDEMTDSDIWKVIGDFAQAAKNAIEAGFDGVEIHGANGFLIDQFLQSIYNKRTDAWGGSIEKRARFGLEVMKAVVAAIGSSRTAIRLSPFFNDTLLSSGGILAHDPYQQFAYLVEQLKPLNLSYLHLMEARVLLGDTNPASDQFSVRFLVEIWNNQSPVFLSGGYGVPGFARKAVDEKWKEYDIVVAIGRHFVSNPDLVFRMREGLELTQYNRDTFYAVKDLRGYIDYPFSAEFLARERS